MTDNLKHVLLPTVYCLPPYNNIFKKMYCICLELTNIVLRLFDGECAVPNKLPITSKWT